jgi:hypothetical protein
MGLRGIERAVVEPLSLGQLGDVGPNPPRLAVAIVLSSRDIAAAWRKATHVVAIFSTDAHAFTEGKDDKTSKRSGNGKTDKPMRNGHASLLAPHLAESILVRAAIIITVKSDSLNSNL